MFHEPYSAATEENGFPYGDYLLVSGFLDQAKPELEKAGEYLGLSSLELQKEISSPKDLDSDDSSWRKASRNALAFLVFFLFCLGLVR